jgi:hypothetical protein
LKLLLQQKFTIETHRRLRRKSRSALVFKANNTARPRDRAPFRIDRRIAKLGEQLSNLSNPA